ncbi:hypothetical protein PVAND_012760 [Polypedilum vanderplanki]|uniref:cathepsin L n=1 Tax=Polypedilum vanderplanki TaxID=319348 RepID=A0A9J6CPC8_POLVA|nr:hypothetical protein PVAND_012760 [Polypedilum vanderplanki]
MRQIVIIGFALIASASCQIYTKIQSDGYHYNKPAPEVSFKTPEKNQCSNGAQNPPYCCLNGADNEYCQLPQPFQPAPQPVEPEQAFTLPPLPSFIPQINLPKVIPVDRPLPVNPDVSNIDIRTNAVVDQSAKPQPDITLPPLPSFIPQINLPKVIPVDRPLPVKPDVQPVVDQPAPFAPPQSQPRVEIPAKPKLTNNEYLPPLADESSEWEAWKRKYNKNYDTPEEEERRRLIFEANVDKIKRHNKDFAAGSVSFDLEINKFADMEKDEFIRFNTGIRRKGRSAAQSPTRFYGAPYPSSARAGFNAELGFDQDGFGSGRSSDSASGRFGGSSDFGGSSSDGFGSSSSAEQQGRNMMNVFMPSSSLASEVKEEVDWRKEGAITPVKNQGKCASCWAFSANGALEAHNFLRKRTGPIPLSEQNLIDCVTENDGCDGGYMTNAYEYVARNPGVDTEASYPYEQRNSTCRFKRENVGGECMTHMEIQIGNEEALKQAVATVGPVAAGIDGGQHSFQFYKSGFYYEPKCDQDVNHAVLIVGYGKTETGEEYWICKNSWDTDWGEEGYVRMAKNRNNHCGITNLASYPIV